MSDDYGLTERQNLLTRLLDAVKQCQVRFGGRSELATDGDSRVSCLCSAWEMVLQHGLRHNNKALSAFKQVTEMTGLSKMTGVFGDIKNLETEPVFWLCIREYLDRHEIQRYNSLRNITSESGKGRAWLRSALNEHSLERYLHMLLESNVILSQFYEDWAFLRDEERSSMLPMMAAGLGSILFAISIDKPELNTVRQPSNFVGNAPSIPSPRHAEPLPVIAGDVNDPTVEKRREKRKKKRIANIISFDDDDCTLSSNSPSSVLSASLSTTSEVHSRFSFDRDIDNGQINGDISTAKMQDIPDRDDIKNSLAKTTHSFTFCENSVNSESDLPKQPQVICQNDASHEGSVDSNVLSLSSLGELSRNGHSFSEPISPTAMMDHAVNEEMQQESSKLCLASKSCNVEFGVEDNCGKNDIGADETEEEKERSLVATTLECVTLKSSQEDESIIPTDSESFVVKNQEEKERSLTTELESVTLKSSQEDESIIPTDSESFVVKNQEEKERSLTTTESESVTLRTRQESECSLVMAEPSHSRDNLILRSDSQEKISQSTSPNSLRIYQEDSSEYTSHSRERIEVDMLTPIKESGQTEDFSFCQDMDGSNGSNNETESITTVDSVDVPMYEGPEVESATAALLLAQTGYNRVLHSDTDPPKINLSFNAEAMSKDDLRQAVITMMMRKDEVEEQNKLLKTMLDQEIEVGSVFRAQVDDLKVKLATLQERDHARFLALQKENELLKHQLRKYVSAVQMLRTEAHTGYEPDGSLGIHLDTIQPPIPPAPLNIDYSDEAMAYEKKLIQVAEMHGELMEFNEMLHRKIIAKDAVIARLQEDMAQVRGPLMDWDAERVVDIEDQIMDGYQAPSRTPINIWIPSAFLRGDSTGAHHVYQVYTRIGDQEWNIYRRYSEFYLLFKSLKKAYPIVGSYDFPAKKVIRNKNSRLVEHRRIGFQNFLRRVVNYLLQHNDQFLTNISRDRLVAYLPFFGDTNTIPSKPQRSTRQSNPRVPSSEIRDQSRNTSSAQYMGL